MRVLVTWGSKRGGTEGIGRQLAEALHGHGLEIVASSVERAGPLEGFDAVIVGGALYANRWSAMARKFVTRHVEQLRKVPVWLFSSGPLDDSADRESIPATAEVAILAERIGALGHVTFGGRLARDAKGFPASAMAKTRSGDWRNPDRIRAWARELAAAIPGAVPGRAVTHPARSLTRLFGYALTGWAIGTLVSLAVQRAAGTYTALVAYLVAAPLLCGLLARDYFGARGARDPLPTALAWTTTIAFLDLIAARLAPRTFGIWSGITGAWLPFGLILLATWVTGEVIAMAPHASGRPGHTGSAEGRSGVAG